MSYKPVRYYTNFFLELCEEFTCFGCGKTKIHIWEKLENGLKYPAFDMNKNEEDWWWIKEDECSTHILCPDCYFKIFNTEKNTNNNDIN